MKKIFKPILLSGFLIMAWSAYRGEYYEFVSEWGSMVLVMGSLKNPEIWL